MKKLSYKLLIILSAASLLNACDTSISDSVDDFEASAGDVDFSTFVAVGDSLTAGIADGALYRDGQRASYPAILARQFGQAVAADNAAEDEDAAARMVGDIEFTQPLMPRDATGSLTLLGNDLGISDRLVAVASGDDDIPVTPDTIKKTVATAIDVPLTGEFNNMGVPGAKSYHLGAAGYGNAPGLLAMPPTANPFLVRFASSGATSVIADAAALVPTFFILWIGSNDILSYATSGGTGTDQNAANNANPATYGPAGNDITDDVAFSGIYAGLVNTLKTADNKGVLVNIPQVTAIPFFTTVAFDAIPLNQNKADLANAGFQAYNDGLDFVLGLGFPGLTAEEVERRKISFDRGQNPIVILDETLTDLTPANPALINLRQATEDDLILLTAASVLGEDDGMGGVIGVSSPLGDELVLIPSEQKAIERARKAFNETIHAAADADDDILLFDAAGALEELATTGISYGSGGVSSAFIQGGAISLDGIHPTARGNSVVANLIIALINRSFGSSIAPTDPNGFATITYQD